MRAAAGAVDFGAAREQAVVFFGADMIFDDGLKKARPPRAGIKLGFGTEQVKVTGDAPIQPGVVIVPVWATERAFGAFLASNAVLLRSEQFLPFSIGFNDFLDGHIR